MDSPVISIPVLIRLVIPSEARDLEFAARCRSLASLGMTSHRRVISQQQFET
jgi:hypothetical protein